MMLRAMTKPVGRRRDALDKEGWHTASVAIEP